MSDALCICVSSATAAGYTGLENSCIEQRTIGQSLTRELRLTIGEHIPVLSAPLAKADTHNSPHLTHDGDHCGAPPEPGRSRLITPTRQHKANRRSLRWLHRSVHL